MARKVKFSIHHTFIVWPHYLAKQALQLISVLNREREYFSRTTLWCQSEYLVWGRQGWSSSILKRKLTAHATTILSSERICCLISEQYVVITGGHCSRMERQRTPPGQRWTIRKKSTSTSLNLAHIWRPNSPDINPVDYASWGALQQRVYHQQQFKTVEELKRVIVTEWHKFSQRFIDNSINEWRRRLETVINNGGGHIEHCNLAWAAAHHFNTIERYV